MIRLKIETPATILKNRMKNYKETLKEKKIGFEEFLNAILENFPEYNCVEGINHCRNFFYLRVADLNLCEATKELIEKIFKN